jgi:polyvinyl alcohol dehydrogenase (cytochrome)
MNTGPTGLALSIALQTFAGASQAAQAPDGAALYKQHCATCHDAGFERAPGREALREMAPERVLAAMEEGVMVSMASRLNTTERRAIAEVVAGRSFSQPLDTTPPPDAMCAPAQREFDPWSGPRWIGWGVDTNNTRYQDAASASLTPASVARLRVKWAFGFPGDTTAYAQPTVAGGRVFVGSQGGKVYALSAATGCVHWFFDAGAPVRTAVTLGRIRSSAGPRTTAFFGDLGANMYALDAATGRLLWKNEVDAFPLARITGSPVFHNGRIYVGVASGEESAAASPEYACCRFRGSLVALDAASGRRIWKTHMIAEEAQPRERNRIGTQMWGPSGAPIWTSAAVDTARNALYVTTGDNYSDPPTSTSDAFVALDLSSGRILWSRQMTPSDAWNVACRIDDTTNCPASNGPDFDFAASPILVTLPSGRRLLVAGQKSGVVHAVDPDRLGEIVWQVRVGTGGIRGGVQWGSATDGTNVYVALSDIGRINVPFSLATDTDPKRGGGMFALRLDNGRQMWHAPPPGCGERPRCSPAQSAAVSATAGVAFSGSVDGHLRAYSMTDGAILWDFDTVGAYRTVNGVAARGGSLDGAGPAIAGGMLFVNSGYVGAGGMPGNVLLAFSVDGK